MKRWQHILLWLTTVALCGTVALGNANFVPPDWAVTLVDATGTSLISGGAVKVTGGGGGGATQVEGRAASGAAVTGNPVLTGGSDGANARTFLTDSSGREIVTGAAAEGAAVAGNPVMVGGWDGTNTRTFSFFNSGTNNMCKMSPCSTGGSAQGFQTVDGDTTTFGNNAFVRSFGVVYNNTNYDRMRSAGAVAGTSGTGLLGAGVLGFNSADSNYYTLRTESASNPNLRCVIFSGATQVPAPTPGDTVANQTGLGIWSQQGVYNSTSTQWERARSAISLDAGLTTGVPASHQTLVDNNNGTFTSVNGQGEYRSRVTSATNTQNQLTIDLRNLHDTLSIHSATSAGTATLQIESSADNANWIALEAPIAAAATNIKVYTATTVGGTVALSPLSYRFCRITAGSAGVGNTTTLTIGAK